MPASPREPETAASPTMSAATPAPRSASKRLWGVFSLILGVAIFAGLIAWLSPDAVELSARMHFEPGWLALGLVGSAIASVVTAARWQILAEEMGGTPLPFVSYLHALVFTRFLGQFVPSLAMDLLGRGIALKTAGSAKSLVHTMLQVVVERSLDVLQPVLLVVWILLLGPRVLPSGAGIDPGSPLVLCIVAALICLLSAPLLRPLALASLRGYAFAKSLLPGRRAAAAEGSLHPARMHSELGLSQAATPEVVLNRRTSLWVAFLSWARLVTVVLQFFGVVRGVGLSVSLGDVSFATQLAQLAGLVGLTPGALGIQEAGWTGAMQMLGHDAVTTSLLILSTRLGLITYFGTLTVVTLLLWRRYGTPARDPLDLTQ